MNEATSDDLDPTQVAAVALDALRERVRARPLPTLAALFGVGYVLGGGLPRVVVRLGSVFALRAIAQKVVVRSLQAGHPAFFAEGSHDTASEATVG